MDEIETDFQSMFTLANIQDISTDKLKLLENSYRALHIKLRHIHEGPLTILKNNGLDIFSNLSGLLSTTQDPQTVSNLAAITNALINGLETYQVIVNYLRHISRLYSLEIRIDENESWEGITINDRLIKLRSMASSQ